MTKFLTATILVFGIGSANGQSHTPSAVTCAATTMSQSNGSISFTVGELVVEPQTDANGNTLGGGFTNGSVITTTVIAVDAPNVTQLNVTVYPNPTADMITVDVQEIDLPQLVIRLTDMQGKVLFDGSYAGMSNRMNINLAAYPSGSYLLSLMNTDGSLLGSYRIVRQ